MSVTDGACRRWSDLSDREALGEVLTTEERAFARQHVTVCSECRGESEVWNELAALVDGASSSPHAPSEEPVGSSMRRRRARWPWWVGVAAACAGAAAAAAFVMRGTAGNEPPASARAPAAASKDATVILTDAGAVEIDGRAGVVGQTIARGSVLVAREGSACVTSPPAVRACIVRGSVLRLMDLGVHRRFELLGGKVSVELDPLPAGSSFGIATRGGSAVAIGTAFSVEVPPGDAPIVTRVFHGEVLVRASDGTEQHVTAHEQTSMRSAKPSPLSPAEEEREQARVHGTTPEAPPVASAPSSSAPPRAGVRAKSAAELLVVARESGARGDPAAAVAAYRELFGRYRDSAEAHAALVPWGELQLSRLSDPEGARVSFERYLARGGPLEEEASFGRIRAFRALERTREERAAIEAFLVRFPRGSLAPLLRERLLSIDGR